MQTIIHMFLFAFGDSKLLDTSIKWAVLIIIPQMIKIIWLLVVQFCLLGGILLDIHTATEPIYHISKGHHLYLENWYITESLFTPFAPVTRRFIMVYHTYLHGHFITEPFLACWTLLDHSEAVRWEITLRSWMKIQLTGVPVSLDTK